MVRVLESQWECCQDISPIGQAITKMDPPSLLRLAGTEPVKNEKKKSRPAGAETQPIQIVRP
jgi:hypothetical protein